MAKNISFASFNLYNFQSAGKTIYNSTTITEEAYIAKRDWIQAMLVEISADIVAFQELWSREALEDVLSAPALEDYQPIYIKDNWYAIAVAMVVRKPWQIRHVETIKVFPFQELVKLDDRDGEDDDLSLSIKKFSRSVLKVVISHEDESTPDITIFACHLKSKRPATVSQVDKKYRNTIGSAVSTIRRTAEATALRMLLTEHLAGSKTPTVVLGDLNDDPHSNTLSLITEQPTMSKFSHGRDQALYSTLFLQQLQSFRDVFYTHEYNNHKSVLDHILVSEEFFEYSTDSQWSHSETRIWNDQIEDKHAYTSDHGIIKSSFR